MKGLVSLQLCICQIVSSKLVASSSPEKPAALCNARCRFELIEFQPKSKEASRTSWAGSSLKVALRVVWLRAQALEARFRSSLTHSQTVSPTSAFAYLPERAL